MAGSGDERFSLLPMAIGEYRRADFGKQVLAVEEQVELLDKLLAPFGAEVIDWDVDMDQRKLGAAMDRLQAWSEAQEPGPSVLYWVGHGFYADSTYFLPSADSVGKYPGSGITPNALKLFVAGRQAQVDPPWCIVIVDACQGEGFATALSAALMGRPLKNTLIIGSTVPGATTLGKVNAALETVLETVFGHNDEITLFALLESVRDDVNESPLAMYDVGLRTSAKLARKRVVPLAVSPKQRPGFESALMAVTADDRRAFVDRVDQAEMAWRFAGRDRERTAIVTWTRSSAPLMVVSGPPGTGKSALLGEVFVRSWPTLRDELRKRGAIDRLEPADTPDDDVFRAPIRVAGQTTVEAMRLIGAALGWSCPADASPSEQMEALLEASRSAGALLIVDGIDEAYQPLGTARLLRSVADAGSRLLVGTRPSTQTDVDAEGGEQEDPDILDALVGPEHDGLLSLAQDRKALGRFVSGHFAERLYGLDRGYVERQSDHIAETLGKEGAEFLRARLVLRELDANSDLLEIGREDDLEALLALSHGDVFERFVGRLSERSPAYRPILEALALAQGRGIPVQHGILASVATALATAPLPQPIDATVIRELLHEAEAYVVSESEHGQTVYRLAHRVFSDHLAEEGGWLSTRHTAVARALMAIPGGERRPYVVHYLSRHLALGEPAAWAELAGLPRLLDAIDVHGLTADAHKIGLSQLDHELVATISVQDLIAESAVDETVWAVWTPGPDGSRYRAGLRQLGAARLRPSSDEVAPAPGELGWSVRWSALRRKPPHVVALRGNAPILALACTEHSDAPVIAALFADRTIRLWDTTSGSALGPPLLLDGEGEVQAGALAIVEPENEGALLLAGVGAQVTVWDLLTGVCRTTIAVKKTVTALTGYVEDQAGLRLITGGPRGVIQLWGDDGRSIPVGSAEQPAAGVQALVYTKFHGQRRLLAGGEDEQLRSYRVSEDATLVAEDPEPKCHVLDEWVRDIAVYAKDGKLRAIAVGDEPGLAIWEIDGNRRTLLDGIPENGRSVTTYLKHGDRRQHVVGGVSGNLYALDAGDPAPAPQIIDAHVGEVAALAMYRLGGSVRLVSGGADKKVMIWEPDVETLAGAVPPPSACRVAACAGPDGTPLLAVGGDDGSLRLLRLEDGSDATPAGMKGGVARVTALRAVANDRLAVGYADGAVVLWDPAAGTRQASLTHSWAVRAIVTAEIEGRELLVTATETGVVRGWEPTTSDEQPSVLHEYAACVRELLVLGDHLLVVGTGREPVELPLAAGADPASPFGGGENWLTAACHVGEAIVAGDDDGTIHVWDRDGPVAPRSLTGHHDAAITALAPYGSTGYVISGSRDGTVQVLDPNSGAVIDVLRLGMPVNDLQVLPGSSVAVATDDGVLVIDLNPPPDPAEGSGDAATLPAEAAEAGLEVPVVAPEA